MGDLGDRMKLYEASCKPQLPPRLPIVVRVDGRAFHSFTAKMEKPFDVRVMAAMDAATVAVAEKLQGCIFAYSQSDEASFVLQSDRKLTSQMPWGGDLVKLVSTTAGAMTARFMRAIGGEGTPHFDARAFVMPWDDVPNYLLWRYRDWVKNSVTMAAQAHFSHRELHGKNTGDKLGMLDAAGFPWERESARARQGMFWPAWSGLEEPMAARGYEDFRAALDALRQDAPAVAEATIA